MTETLLVGTVPKNGAEEVRVALTSYKGTAIVDLRACSEFGDAPERRPTKKGVALQVGRLPTLIEKLQLAEAEAPGRSIKCCSRPTRRQAHRGALILGSWSRSVPVLSLGRTSLP